MNETKIAEKKYIEFANAKIEEMNENGKKTVAIFCDVFYPSVDGVISVVNNIAIQMSKFFNVVVCVPKHKGITTQRKEYLVLGVRSAYISMLKYSYCFYPSSDKVFVDQLKRLRIDLVHFHSPFAMGQFAARFARKRNIPLIATLHSQYKLDFENVTKNKIMAKLLLEKVVKTFNKADALTTMNPFCEKIAREYGITIPIEIIQNATNMLPFDNAEKIAETKAKYGIDSKRPVLLSVGRLVRVKNLNLLIDSLKLLKEKNFDFIAIVVGEGSMRKSLEKKVQKFGLSNNVFFTGLLTDFEELCALYSISDLFLLPSVYETVSLVRIEAAIQCTASLVVENTVSASLIVDGENGFIAKNNSIDFANKIVEIFSDKNKLKKASQNAQKDMSVHWSDVAIQIKAFYEKMLLDFKSKKQKAD